MPAGYDGTIDVPVVYMFHGTSGDGDRHYRISGWPEKAEKEGFIAVFPTSLRYCIEEDGKTKKTTKWNEGAMDRYLCDGEIPADDISYVKQLMETINVTFSIDKSKVFVTGFSNGGSFANRIAVELSDRVAAGGFYSEGKPNAHIPLYEILGSEDAGVIEKVGGAIPHKPTEIMDGFLGTQIRVILDRFDLSESYTTETTKKSVTLTFENSSIGKDNILKFSILKGVPHKYPNGNEESNGLVAADNFWDFFMEVTK
ncbi:MAG: hypothetical protein GY810_29510 [Aureispira sp.]|nr:hypothetical protein [Aureispira sp.]